MFNQVSGKINVKVLHINRAWHEAEIEMLQEKYRLPTIGHKAHTLHLNKLGIFLNSVKIKLCDLRIQYMIRFCSMTERENVWINKCSEIMFLIYTLEKRKKKNSKMCYTWPKCETTLRVQKLKKIRVYKGLIVSS